MCLLVIAVLLKNPQLNSDILSLLPESEPRLADVERHFFASNKHRVIFSVTGKQAAQVHDQLQSWLGEKGLNQDFQTPKIKEIAEFYSPYIGRLISDEYKTSLTSPEAFQRYYFSKLSQVAHPYISSTINNDPSLSLASFLNQNITSLQQFNVHNGRLTANKNGVMYYLVFARINENGFSVNQSVELSNTIRQELVELASTYPDAQVRYSGALFHTSANVSQAKYEMALFGSLSLLAVILIVSWVFRSISALWIASFTVVSAVLGGAIALVAMFAHIHVLTLVFAVTLIGIAVDYAFHGMLDLTVHESLGFSKGLKSALLLSLTTTALGYASLFFSPMLLLTQVGVFVVAGLFSAWLCARLLLPQWQRKITVTKTVQQYALKFRDCVTHYINMRIVIFSMALVVIITSYLMKPVSFNNDVRLLNASPISLVENENFHRTLLAKGDGQIMILYAQNPAQLLEKLTSVKRKLLQQYPTASVNTVSDLVPSYKTQSSNVQLMQKSSDQGILQPIVSMTGQPVTITNNQLTLAAALNSPLRDIIHQQVIISDNVTASWFMVNGIDIDTELLVDFASDYDDLVLYNKVAMISAGLAHYNDSLLATLWVAGLFAVLLFTWRFGLPNALKQGSVLLLTLGLILTICNLLQGSLSIFNLLGCLLVMALAIDYVVFYQINKVCVSNLIAITLSAISSMWVFGMLVASLTPAIFSFGLTVIIGLVAIYLLAPLTLTPASIKDEVQ